MSGTLDHAYAAPEARRGNYDAIKRALDVELALLVLVVLAPLIVVVAVLIKLESPGPVIFRQRRAGSRRIAGRPGWEIRPFQLYKFRSMRQDADASLHEEHVKAYVEGSVEDRSGERAGFKLRNDPRVTHVGAFLRRTSIDELPQLVNVICGDMSLVGPRPIPLYELSWYESAHRQRFAALPGITGLWQVSGRCALPFEEMNRLDVEYIRSQSLTLDLKILLRTIPAVLSGRGAG